MLKSLELSGFKSFADKNRFEFSAGLTVIVGPNGSGKSNVVDAMKWVLGEQSMKSLRGKESSDVIFNGCSGRKPMNMAEVTLTFDNSDHRMEMDATEIAITRRIFRGGEGEYLLNRQTCRLRDIRELLMGTGLGAQAYSIIEQGRVDSLLQSSPKDRRVLFEEAAGISRFKANKIEVLRRMERIKQQLERLAAVVGEIENNLNRVKSQAQRATLFREYSDRLQELRFHAAAFDYEALKQKLEAVSAKLDTQTAERESLQSQLDATESNFQLFESSSLEYETNIRLSTDQIGSNRHSIGESESLVRLQLQRGAELAATIRTLRGKIQELRQRRQDILTSQTQTENEYTQAQTQHEEVIRNLSEASHLLEESVQQTSSMRTEKEQLREESYQCVKRLSAAENGIHALVSQQENAEQQSRQNEERLTALVGDMEKLQRQTAEQERIQAELEALHRSCEDELSEAQQELEACERLWNEAKNNLTELHRRHSSMQGRISTLEELQERHEGLSPGVRYLLTEARQHADGPFRDIRGLVADLIQVNVDAASLMEVALGEKAQYLVVAPGSTLMDALKKNSQGFPGRVGFVWMDEFLPKQDDSTTSRFCRVLITNALQKQPGILGRADQFIQCEEMYLPLFKFLLGETWIVEDLSRAIDLSHEICSGKLRLPVFPAIESKLGSPVEAVTSETLLPRVHFVTRAGERYDADGLLCLGPQHASSGLISRRSELRTLGSQLTLLLNEIRRSDEEVQKNHQEMLKKQDRVDKLEEELAQTDGKLREHEKFMTATRERKSQMTQRETELTQNRVEWQNQLTRIENEIQTARKNRTDAEVSSDEIRRKMEALDADLIRCDDVRAERNRTLTECQVRKAKSEERLQGLKIALQQFDEALLERERSIEEQNSQLEQSLQQSAEAERLTLQNDSLLATLYAENEEISGRLAELRQKRDVARKERAEISVIANRLRKKLRTLDETLNSLQLEKGKFEQDSRQIVQRLCEDYDITHEAFFEQIRNFSEDETIEHAGIQKEIVQLRAKIQALGNINSEALSEMDELQARFDMVHGRLQDLYDSRDKLLKFIEKINVESRQIFMETFERIKEYFYHIFRDLFGGGRAELQLEEGVDVLESGIEIIAQPPGKELRSLSLMSGGEKTMTCVALLFALFKNHPSQFCILDEVDAALDEANTGRLTGILQQFQEQTQFIVISHSKKTMAAANTIYGVTMQDSGVSRQISVRFEEVGEDGEIPSLGIRLFPPADVSKAG